MNNLILASSSQEKIDFWQQGLTDFDRTVFIKDKCASNRLDTLRSDVVRVKPQILLLDADLLGFENLSDIVSFRRLCAETKIIVLTAKISEDLEWILLKAGMRGCCQNDIKPKLLHQVVMAVQRGELWVRRTLIGRLVDELSKSTEKNIAYRAPLGLLNKLTQREYDIAVRVGNGQNNKQIAQACDVTERTVKAHLTEIFLKLGVSDRLNLALVLAADNRIAFANSDNSTSGDPAQSRLLRLPRAEAENLRRSA